MTCETCGNGNVCTGGNTASARDTGSMRALQHQRKKLKKLLRQSVPLLSQHLHQSVPLLRQSVPLLRSFTIAPTTRRAFLASAPSAHALRALQPKQYQGKGGEPKSPHLHQSVPLLRQSVSLLSQHLPQSVPLLRQSVPLLRSFTIAPTTRRAFLASAPSAHALRALQPKQYQGKGGEPKSPHLHQSVPLLRQSVPLLRQSVPLLRSFTIAPTTRRAFLASAPSAHAPRAVLLR
jgi:hypothetical protein